VCFHLIDLLDSLYELWHCFNNIFKNLFKIFFLFLSFFFLENFLYIFFNKVVLVFFHILYHFLSILSHFILWIWFFYRNTNAYSFFSNCHQTDVHYFFFGIPKKTMFFLVFFLHFLPFFPILSDFSQKKSLGKCIIY